MRSEGGREALMKQTVLSNSVNDQIQTTYAVTGKSCQDVLTLEQSVAELHQMFLDFALLTEQQGELLDQTEYQVVEANDHVEAGNNNTVKAVQYQTSVRKKQWYVIAQPRTDRTHLEKFSQYLSSFIIAIPAEAILFLGLVFLF